MTYLARVRCTLASPSFAAPASIGLLAFLASATGLLNGFVYDDSPIIERNPRVHTLARWWEVFAQTYWPPDWGDTNYRPITILWFAVQWAVGDGAPVVFHVVSVALYVATCVAVLQLARLVLPAAAAWIAAALFAVHPVHVEAVANVVGQSELIVGLCSALAVAAYVTMRGAGVAGGAGGAARGGRDRPDSPTTAVIATVYAVACLSKESGFLLPGLLIAAELTVVGARLEPARRSFRARFAELWPLYGACAAVGMGYLLARHLVLGGFGDDPNLAVSLLSTKERLLTMLGVVPEWARLLLWPAQLSADYSPPGIQLILAPGPAVIPGVVILLGVVLLAVVGYRRRPTVSFGVLWAAVAIFPVSNVFIRSGVILAERTLFLPSLGAMLVLGAAAAWAAERMSEIEPPRRWLLAAPVALVVVLGAVRSADRQLVWRDTETFVRQIIEDAPLSYRAHYMHGMWLFERGRRAEGERHVRLAMALYPHDAGPYLDLADQYRRSGMCEPARRYYRRAIYLGTVRPSARLGLIVCLLRDGHLAEAAKEARIGLTWGSELDQFRRLLAVADSALAATSGVQQAGAARRPRPDGKGPRP